MAKESIFSQFNNPQVYTVVREEYASYFGLTKEECARLLTDCGRVLDEEVRKQYDGYMVGGVELYNPWSYFELRKNRIFRQLLGEYIGEFSGAAGLEKCGKELLEYV